MGYKVFDDKMSFAEMELRETLEKTRSVQMTCPVKYFCYLTGMAFNIFRRTKLLARA